MNYKNYNVGDEVYLYGNTFVNDCIIEDLTPNLSYGKSSLKDVGPNYLITVKYKKTNKRENVPFKALRKNLYCFDSNKNIEIGQEVYTIQSLNDYYEDYKIIPWIVKKKHENDKLGVMAINEQNKLSFIELVRLFQTKEKIVDYLLERPFFNMFK